MIPRTHYARARGGAELAYKVLGDGERDIIFCAPYVSHLDALWELPELVDFTESLTRLGRLIVFDKRGTGLSDRGLHDVSAEQRSDDVIAVMDAAHSMTAVLLGVMDAGATSLVTAARFPDRTRAVIAGEVLACAAPDIEQPWGKEANWAQQLLGVTDAPDGGREIVGRVLGPEVAANPRLLDWVVRAGSMAANPSAAAHLFSAELPIDIRPYLPSVRAPVLVLHDAHNPLVSGEGVRWLAAQLPNATYREVSGRLPRATFTPFDEMFAEIAEFLTGTRAAGDAQRAVATLLVTDLVGSTAMLARSGDRNWKHLLDAHRASVRRALARHDGHEIDTAGDGFLSSFPLPSAALRCAADVVSDAVRLGLEVRAGVHTGEVSVHGPGVVGIAVHIAARVAASAGPSEVLLTEAVRALTAGTDIAVDTAGEHTLKGLPGTWRLYRLATSAVPGTEAPSANAPVR
ncbi:adenylate/guanylate cyclase domain-containing protein [Puerhibacterium sp. TATVAM-FAB25]|uniref:adenylate/guanylate cyclase domain-containing protein n=1 Tax=Puerhibacterium sp. TATVAM-FAB25 TaxID=3093699 RepID=UPI00397CF411